MMKFDELDRGFVGSALHRRGSVDNAGALPTAPLLCPQAPQGFRPNTKRSLEKGTLRTRPLMLNF